MKLSYVALLLSLLMLQQGTPCSAVPELVFTISSPNGIECNSTEPRYSDDWQYHIFHEIEKAIESNQGFLYAFRKNNVVKIFVYITVCYNHSTNSSSQCSTKPLGIYLWGETFQKLMDSLSSNFALMDLGVLSILTRAIVSSSATLTLSRSESFFQVRTPYTTVISLNATVLCPLQEGFGVERYMEILQLAWEDFIPWLKSYTEANGEPVEFDNTKRGSYYIQADAINPSATLLHSNYANILLTFHILVIILVTFAILRVTPIAYSEVLWNTERSKTHSSTLSIYWAVVLFSCVHCMLVLLLYLFWFVMVMAAVSGADWGIRLTRTNMRPLIVGLVCLPLLGLLHLGYCIRIIQTGVVHIDVPRVCCCSCRCHCHANQFHCLRQSRCTKAIETLALWIIVMATQSLAFSIIGLGIQLADEPLPTIGALSLLGSSLFLAAMLTAHIIQTTQRQATLNLVTAVKLILEVLVGLIFLAIVALSLVVYIAYTTSRLDTTAIGSLVAALGSSLILSGAGWLTKSRLLETEDENETTPLEEAQISTTTDTDNDTDIASIGMKLIRKTVDSV